jgi:hypothetical protein
MSSKVFLSWSGDVSKKLAEAFKDWVPNINLNIKTYFTPHDIEFGRRWRPEIAKQLETCNCGIVFLTRENMNRSWLLFEAGALAKRPNSGRAISLLFGMEMKELQDPLAQFQSLCFEKDGIRNLLAQLNKLLPEVQRHPDSKLDELFSHFWPTLDEAVKKILSSAKDGPPPSKLKIEDMVYELLQLTKSYQTSDYWSVDYESMPFARGYTREAKINILERLGKGLEVISYCLYMNDINRAGMNIESLAESLHRLQHLFFPSEKAPPCPPFHVFGPPGAGVKPTIPPPAEEK